MKHKQMVLKKGIIQRVCGNAFTQRKQFNETNVTSHAFQQNSDLKIFLECFRGPLKTLLRACSWTTLV